jgi:hypothetical protein
MLLDLLNLIKNGRRIYSNDIMIVAGIRGYFQRKIIITKKQVRKTRRFPPLAFLGIYQKLF